MSDVILRVENVSKQYRLGSFGTNTIGGDVHRWWTTKIRGKEDPFLKVGDVNDRTSKVKSDFVWALKDINFEVKRGEVLGIIGKNGAGKSTLLKLLSRITTPTTGSIDSWGRMASLLEVGTGFHPELTGRENIFLNGAILGMTKGEIKRKLDEIIDFSGCALYIDTPVKRYSSGMTVRLGFAVAAFLDPEILIVDEVLAVGDAEFQKKAIGKMQDISRGEGRTVLFVSHNMESVEQLCTSAVILDNGTLNTQTKNLPIKTVIEKYISGMFQGANNIKELSYLNINKGESSIQEIKFLKKDNTFDFNEEIEIVIKVYHFRDCVLSIEIANRLDVRIILKETDVKESGLYQIRLPRKYLLLGEYKVKSFLSIPNIEIIQESSFLNFEITTMPSEFLKYSNLSKNSYPFGYLYLPSEIGFKKD